MVGPGTHGSLCWLAGNCDFICGARHSIEPSRKASFLTSAVSLCSRKISMARSA